jgi:large subunit ribosomal protein L22
MTANIEVKKNIPSYEENIAAKAFLNNGKISPRKIALMIDEVRNKTVEQAKKILKFSKKKSSDMLIKLVDSAVANAIHNNNYNKEDAEKLIISAIWVGKGMMLKRTEPRARGSGNRILKRYSNVSLYLREKNETLDEKKTKKIKVAKVEVTKTEVVKDGKKTKSKLGEVK